MTTFSYGFRLVGAFTGERRLIDWAAAFSAYASCDPRADLDRESYLSVFCYGDDMLARADGWGVVDTAGFEGACWAPWLPFDIDRPDICLALKEARRLAAFLDEHFVLRSEDDLLAFLSGNKGFHLAVPTSLWCPEPSVDFHRVARRFAARLGEQAGVTVYAEKLGYRIDEGVYSKVQPFRSPNSRHPKSGRFKRRLRFEELMNLSAERILQMAKRPEPFDIPTPDYRSDRAAAAWSDAARLVSEEAAARQRRRPEGVGKPTLNRLTRDFICDGAEEGDRHRRCLSAAANLAEFHCPPSLAHALLTEPALDSGLSPADTKRQIECGLRLGATGTSPAEGSAETPSAVPPPAADMQAQLTAHWASTSAGAAATPPDDEAEAVQPPREPESASAAAIDPIRAALTELWARPATGLAHVPADVAAQPPLEAEEPHPPADALRAQLAALWASPASSIVPALSPDGSDAAAELRAEGVAIQAFGGRPDPPNPPPGTAFYYADERGRPCAASEAKLWTWQGGPKWYHVDDFATPLAGGGA